MCLCVDGGLVEPVRLRADGTAVLQATGVALTVGQLQACTECYHGRVIGIDAQWILDRCHVLSAGAVSFARGVNDTPKIVALLIAAQAAGLSSSAGLAAVGGIMAVGGLLSARRVAATMSERITTMNHGQGFTANLVTALLVTTASRFGLPVSTTHVSCGSLFGLGVVTRQGRWATIRAIAGAWVITLPVAALCAGIVYAIL
jgi:PiT family inorganic phosphate transporter